MRKTQTVEVRRWADLAEGYLGELAELTVTVQSDLDEVDARALRLSDAVDECAREATARSTGGTKVCLGHAERAREATAQAGRLATRVLREVEHERLRREEEAYARRELIERDYPALAPLVGMDPVRIERALALVEADDYKAVGRALSDWVVATRYVGEPPAADTVTPFITEDTDARELAGVIVAYYSAAPDESLDEVRDGVTWENVDPEVHPGLATILAAAHATGWRAPGVAFGDDPDHAAMLAGGVESAVYGGDDDHTVAEAATLAVARYGILDDDHRPDDSATEWSAYVVPGVPVWLPHVEAWRRDMPTHDDTLVLRQMDRAERDWEAWGQDDYLYAYAGAYAEAILAAETPPTVGEEWDSGIHPEDRAEEARERAQAVVDELDVGLSDVRLEESPLDPDEIAEAAWRDARDDYRLAAAREVGPANTVPLF